MLRRSVDSLLGAVLVAVLLPLVIPSALRTFIPFGRAMKARRREGKVENTRAGEPTFGEFQFERAIEAYEALIDTVLSEDRT